MDLDLAPRPAAPVAGADASGQPGLAARTGLPPDALSLPEIRAALRARLPEIGLPADLALAPIDHLFDHAGSSLRFLARAGLLLRQPPDQLRIAS